MNLGKKKKAEGELNINKGIFDISTLNNFSLFAPHNSRAVELTPQSSSHLQEG